MTLLLVVVGSAVGAPLRYLVDRAVRSRQRSAFPGGILTVNLAGCLVLGGLVGAGAALPGWVFTLVGTGLCGGLTTYSTFSYDTVRLLDAGAYRHAAVNVTVSVLAGLGAALLGHAVVSALVVGA